MLVCCLVLAVMMLLVIFMFWSSQEMPNEGGVRYADRNGGTYHVFGVAKNPNKTHERVVVYRHNDDIYFRNYEEFYGMAVRVDHD